MNEVVIYVKFTTGTTVTDPDKAKETCLAMLKDGLVAGHVLPKDGDPFQGLFQVKILGEHAEKL